ncbi:unnamed protein product [Microthlaspi erraticum]|uniref:HAT C-terminal dimerisation domain-containing protein n=1 Tax=Microthlaspi erraticum TaxID=1685480 RepID=A0A6D2KKK6_9BRAS|nr:unnamed protein product [Microthlaspi erraticum]
MTNSNYEQLNIPELFFSPCGCELRRLRYRSNEIMIDREKKELGTTGISFRELDLEDGGEPEERGAGDSRGERMDSSSNLESSKNNNQTAEDNEEDHVTAETQHKRKEPETASGATSQPKVKKTKSTRFEVWDHFDKIGTSSLKYHLKICKEYIALGPKQTVIDDDGGLKPFKVPESVIREATNEMLVLGQLPLSFIEGIAWKHFCKKAQLYKPKCRKTATTDIVKMYIRKKEELKNWIAANKFRVSLTTDIWVAQVTGASYMAITLHVIDRNWHLKKLIIGFKNICDHKADTINTVLLECLADWGIEKVFCITVDNANANTAALKMFRRDFSLGSDEAFVLGGKFLHMRCCAHIINLIANEGLADLGENVDAIRNAIVYVRASPHRLHAFESKVDSGKMTRGSLPLDVTTRWNSTFLMLTRAMQFRLAFEKMRTQDLLYLDYFGEHVNGIKRTGPPVSMDWEAVNRLAGFLVMFYDSTLVVSASTVVNSCKCYCEIVTIESNLKLKANSSDLQLKEKATEMLEKFRKYWEGMKKLNKMLIVASIFDPRQKMNFAKLCFERLHGIDTEDAVALYDSVYDFLGLMFKEYKARAEGVTSTVPTTSNPSQSAQASVSSGQDQATNRMELNYEKFSYERMDFVYKEMVQGTGFADPRDELDIYLKEPCENPIIMLGTEYEILDYWKHNQGRFPVLCEMAKDLLAMQVSSVASESAFSTSGRVVDPYRSCLTHYTIEVLMCTEQWIKAEIRLSEKTMVTNEQMLAAIEELDELEKEFQDKRAQDLQENDDD